MYTVHQIQQVKNRTVVVDLPQEFPLTNIVEVIILPATELITESEATTEMAATHHFLTMDTSHFTAVQRRAYDRAYAIIRRGRRPDEPRILGLFEGLVQIADDFDAPLPDENMFWGESTNECGMSLER